MVEDVLKEAEAKMAKAVEVMRDELRTVRTGRASPALLERLRVNYYGTPTPLNQMAAISAPEPRLLVVRPWDPSAIPEIEKAILASDVGLTPSTDGTLIRLPVPRLTQERREELSKLVGRRIEEGRISIRTIRRGSQDDLRDLQKEKLISEDELFSAREKLQELHDKYIERIEEVGKTKQEEIMEV